MAEQLPKKATIKPERIWSKEIAINGKPTTKWYIKTGNCIFSSFQEPTFKEGERVEITYDANSKFEQVNEEGKKTFFYNLISKKVSNREILDEIKRLEEKLDLLLNKCENNVEVKEEDAPAIDDIPEEDIPAVEDEDIF